VIGWLFGGVVKKFERAAKDVIQESSQEISNLFDHKLKPLADQFDYVSQQRLQEIEDLETQTKVDIENLLNHANDKARCGWIENLAKNELIKYEDYNFTLDANKGHLPSTPRIVGLGLKNSKEITHRLNIFYQKTILRVHLPIILF
jgi:gas vesicle protein